MGAASGPGPRLPPPARRTSPAACFAWAAASRAFPFSLLQSGRVACSLYFSAPPSAPTAAEGPSARPTVPAARLVRSRPPRLRRGVGALPGLALPVGSRKRRQPAQTLGFPSPAFLSRPTGRCSSSSRRPAPRGNTTWEVKDYKSQHPPRRGRERQGAGHFWCLVVGGGS